MIGPQTVFVAPRGPNRNDHEVIEMADSRICSIANCDKTHYAKGFCQAHYERSRRHGDPFAGRTAEGDPEKFLREVVLPYDGDECVLWPFARNRGGYGQMVLGSRLHRVSRLVCEDVNGPPPTPEHEAAHSCGQGHLGCVTKKHVLWKTPAENQSDRVGHGTHSRGERSATSKLTEGQVKEIRSLKGKRKIADIAAEFGVSQMAVSYIQRTKRWSWL